MAEVLSKPWEVANAPMRVFRATYYHKEHGWRVAQIMQRKGVTQFEIGVVRDCSEGGAEQLRAFAMGTPEAVIWLGLHRATSRVEWLLTL